MNSVSSSFMDTSAGARRASHNKMGTPLEISLSFAIWLPLIILLAGFAVRMALYDYHGLEGDDAFSLSLSRLPVGTLLPGLMAFQLDIHPPLHFLLVKGWASLAGESLLSLRLLNYLMDMGVGALLIRLAGRAMQRRVALVAAVLWAVAPLLLTSDLLVRMYTLLALLAVAGFVCVVEAQQTHGWRRYSFYSLLGVCALAAMYTHMLGFVITVVLAVGIVTDVILHSRVWQSKVGAQHEGVEKPLIPQPLLPRKRAPEQVRGEGENPANTPLSPFTWERGRTGGSGVRGGSHPLFQYVYTVFLRNIFFALLPLLVAAVLSLPYAQALWARYRSGRPLGAEINPLSAFAPAAIPDVVVSTLLTGRAWVVVPFLFSLVIAICIALVCLRYRARVLPLAVMGLTGILAMIALAWIADLYKPRYLAPLVAPLLALLAGAALLPKRALWRGVLVLSLALLSSAGIVADFDRTLRDDWVAAAQFIEAYEQPGDIVIVIPDWGGEAFRFHYDGASEVASLLPGLSAEIDLDSLLSPLVEGRNRVWFVLYQPLVTDPDGLGETWFRARAVMMTEVFPSGIQVRLYDFDPFLSTLPANIRPLDATFGDTLALRGVSLPVTHGSARDSRLHPPSTWVRVELYWESLQPGANVIPRVRFTDGIGQIYGETIPRDNDLLAQYPLSSWTADQIVRASYDLNLNPDTPPGVYNIEVMALNPDTGAPLPSTGADAGAQWVIAGQFTVE